MTKKKRLLMIKLIRVFILLCSALVFGQDYTVEGELSPINENGLYRICIPHNVRSYATNDLRDLRIWDTEGNQVPYYMEPVGSYRKTKISNFTEFSIISNARIVDTSSTYIFKNPYETIEQAVLLIANYEGSKNYRLEGSHNQNQWFGIVNSGQLTQLNYPTETNVYKVINFPLCAYQYIKVVFDDHNSLLVNLLKIGEATTELENIVPTTMEKIPVAAIDFLEKDQKTEIHVRFDRPEVINQIRMVITAPELYSRNARLYTIREREVKRTIQDYQKLLATFAIRSDKALLFDIPLSSEKDIYLEIDHKDNPKLQIKDIHFMQEQMYLVASLKGKETYKVTAGNATLSFPDYDISDVTNTIKSTLPIAQIRSVVSVQTKKLASNTKSFWQRSWFMWCCIGFAALIISYFAFNLLKDLNTTKD